ncbi:MAG TPA: hypothetical protein VGL20_09715 [Candidatus Dormibacteraeota bacterium]|jgi:hypothetical protein
MAQPAWHRHPGALVAARGAVPGRAVPAIVVGPAGGGRRPDIVLAMRRPGGDEWTPVVVRSHQVLATWEAWRGVIGGALDEHARVSRRSVARPAVRSAAPATA